MGNAKVLTREEVPTTHVDRILFDTHRVIESPQRQRKHKRYSVVDIICDVCNKPKQTAVNDVRNWVRGVRKNFPGTHRDCKYEGRSVGSHGYVLIWNPTHPNAHAHGYVLEHVMVMSELLGRKLDLQNESVHHIDGDKENNKLENLQLRTRYHGKGQVRMCNNCGSTDIGTAEL